MTTYEIACDMMEHPVAIHDLTFEARLKLHKKIQKALDKAEKEKWSKIVTSKEFKKSKTKHFCDGCGMDLSLNSCICDPDYKGEK